MTFRALGAAVRRDRPGWLRRLGRRPLVRIAAVVAVTVATATASASRPVALDPPPPPQVGFTFSGWAARYFGEDPVTALGILLDRLHPDVVRLPVYWNDVAPTPDHLDFSGVDALLDRIAAYDATEHRATRVALVVGLRNVGYPEFWVPDWALPAAGTDIPTLGRTPSFARYLTATILRYRHHPLLATWQVENEPYDDVDSSYPGEADLAPAVIAEEVATVHRLDPGHPVLVTSYNSAGLDLDEVGMSIFADAWRHTDLPQFVGHPLDALRAGDILGLDAYVVTSNTPESDDIPTARRIEWKRDSLAWWADYAADVGKPMWIAEMQAMPWQGVAGFTTVDLLESASAYRDVGAQVVLLYGVEYWLTDPDWLLAGTRAVRILRDEEARVPLP